ncbi:hypothetical protein BOX15_Mlig015427g2, partial [Macrostomum lignano]
QAAATARMHLSAIRSAASKFLPLFDRVLVQRFEPQLKTKGGVLLPEKSKGKVLEATVIATGPGRLCETSGQPLPVSVKVGDKVLLPEFGGIKVTLEDTDYFLFRDADILGKFSA